MVRLFCSVANRHHQTDLRLTPCSTQISKRLLAMSCYVQYMIKRAKGSKGFKKQTIGFEPKR